MTRFKNLHLYQEPSPVYAMKHPICLLTCSLSMALAIILSSQSAKAQSIPVKQQQPPATLEGKYPYRPSCLQLIPQLSATNPSFTGWGPVIGGQHQSWYGLPTGMEISKALTQLDALGFCVIDGEVVPWQAVGDATGMEASDDMSPLDRNVERLKNAPDANSSQDAGAGAVVFLALLLAGGVWLLERFESKPWMQRLMGETVTVPALSPALPSGSSSAPAAADAQQPKRRVLNAPTLPTASDLPDRISRENLQTSQAAAMQQQTALEVLLKSPFLSRAFYGFQRTGKTNLVASAMQKLAKQGINVYSLNLNSFGPADSFYWQGCSAVHGDLTYITDPVEAEQLIKRATALVDAFMNDRSPSILIVDEWAPMTASYSEHIALLEPLIKSLATKITGFSSSGMQRDKAIYTIASEIVAGTMEDFGKAVKKLSVCLVGIAPGHTAHWKGQELTFSWELYSQVNQNYPRVLSPPPEDSDASRIAFINNKWRPLGTTALVEAAVATADADIARKPATLPTPVPLSEELQLFRQWLDKKVGETITLQMYKNARIFREKVERSETQYLSLCDKAVMKGWLSQTTQHTFFVLE